MEQDKLPCGAVLSPDGVCDREVFERVWRRVMPEDRPDCPFTLEPGGRAAPAAASNPSNPCVTPGADPCAAPPDPEPDPCAAMPLPDMFVPDPCCAPPALVEPACPQPRMEAAEDGVPCLGSSSAVYGAQLQAFIDSELCDWRTYQLLARRAQSGGARVLSTIAADERRHAKRLSTAYFLISGVRYLPVDRAQPIPVGTFLGALRDRFAEEQRGEAAYLAAAEECTDPCLRELYVELAGDENAHAWLLRGVLEQLC